MNAQPLLSKSLRTSENRTSLAIPRLYPRLSCLQKAGSFSDAVDMHRGGATRTTGSHGVAGQSNAAAFTDW